jgi:PPOX class probable F420-dependent enzyme
VVGLDRVKELGGRENGLVVVVTSRADGTIQASVVNAGVLDDPFDGAPIVAFVARGGAKKLVNLRVRPRLTFVFRSGWEWVAVEGDARLVGPDDPLEGLESADALRLIRDVYAVAAGGGSDDWAELDDVLVAERHTAVLVRPVRVYSNPGT